THDVATVRPAQPSFITQGVNAIQPSRFAPGITLERQTGAPPPQKGYGLGDPSPPPPASTGSSVLTKVSTPSEDPGPIVHFAAETKNYVVEVPFESGQIVFVSDPYIVSNTGINVADNARFATDVVATAGTIAFDEYHQGYSNDSNRFLSFF